MGDVNPPHLVCPVTVEPSKPRVCHDALQLDTLLNLPRYVGHDNYQTIVADKSGYDYLLLTEERRTFFGIQWDGWYFVYNTQPLGWKISPFVYHSTGLMVSNFFHSIGIPGSFYIDDRHNGHLQISPKQGAYASFRGLEEHNFRSCKICYLISSLFFIKLGYFLGHPKSILVPHKVVPYLGYLSDSLERCSFILSRRRRNF